MYHVVQMAWKELFHSIVK